MRRAALADHEVSVTVTHSGREEHVLRLEADAPDLLAYARQAEALGFSAVDLLNEALLAELDVRWYEKKSGTALNVRRFMQFDFSKLTPEDWRALDVLPKILSNVPTALGCWRVRQALEWLRAEQLMHLDKDLPRELRDLLARVDRAKPKKLGWYVKREARKKRRGLILQAAERYRRLEGQLEAMEALSPEERERARGTVADAVKRLGMRAEDLMPTEPGAIKKSMAETLEAAGLPGRIETLKSEARRYRRGPENDK